MNMFIELLFTKVYVYIYEYVFWQAPGFVYKCNKNNRYEIMPDEFAWNNLIE